MKSGNRKVCLLLSLVVTLGLLLVVNGTVLAATPAITMPASGFAATGISGTGFSANSIISVTFNATAIVTVPAVVTTDAAGKFSALIAIPTSTAGIYPVKATDAAGGSASANFTVVDKTGARGATGAAGAVGPAGPVTVYPTKAGEPGKDAPVVVVWISLILAVAAIIMAVLPMVRKPKTAKPKAA